MPPVLDVAIGTIFVFLLFSLVLSALNEVVLSFFDQRAKFLQMGLKELLGNDQRVKALCEHGLINAFSRTDKGNRPSYIPAGAFVTTLLELLLRKSLSPAASDAQAGADVAAKGDAPKANDLAKTPPSIPDLSKGVIPEELKNYIVNLPDDDKLGQSLRSLLMVAGQDVAAFKTAVEGWFNDAMDRVSGWYKRFSQTWMIIIGFVLAAAVNVDAIRIVQTLSTSPNLAKAVTAQAESYAKSNQRPLSEEEKKQAQDAKQKTITDAQNALLEAQKTNDMAKVDAAQKKLDDAKKPAEGKTPDQAVKDYQKALDKLGSTGVPIGWDQTQTSYFMGKDLDETGAGGTEVEACGFTHFWRVIMVVCGWLLTALAASLGAPFWFDMLSRFVNIRNAGKAPNEKDPTESAKAPAPTSLNATPGAAGATAG
jgi:hypothetical protein